MRILPGLSLLLALFGSGCEGEAPLAEPSAEIGIFFGGQVQRVKKVEVPAVRPPKIGFRVIFPEDASPAQRSEPIKYEVVRPGPAGRRVTEKGTLRLPPGQERLDHVLALSAVDSLGVWNVRVVQSETVLADRALYLVPARHISP